VTGENGQGLVAQSKAELKVERKAVRDAVREERRVGRRRRWRLAETLEPLVIRERIRNQWEVLDLERRFLEDLDQSVRYALIVFGVINTAAVLVLARGNALPGGSGPTEWGVRLFVTLYALLRSTLCATRCSRCAHRSPRRHSRASERHPHSRRMVLRPQSQSTYCRRERVAPTGRTTMGHGNGSPAKSSAGS
jgi:hypothetical protein